MTDSAQLDAIMAYLIHTHNIPKSRIRKDPYVLFDESYRVLGLFRTISDNMLAGTITHRPDIVVLDGFNRISCMIELDGSVHTQFTNARRRTRRRNRNYSLAGIPYCVINIRSLAAENTTWFEHLDRFMSGRKNGS